MPYYNYAVSSGIYYTEYGDGMTTYYMATDEQIQKRIDKAKQLEEDKRRYPLFFLKEGIV